MNAPRAIVTWQPVLTDHMAFTLEEVARRAGTPVIAYVSRLEDATRRAQGWRDTSVTSVERRLLPRWGRLRHCVRALRAHRDDVHLFGSPFADATLILALICAVAMGVQTYLLSEPYSPTAEGYFSDSRRGITRVKAWARPLVYRVYVAMLRRGIAGVFAMSRLAAAQYLAAGMQPAKIFPFGYFVPRRTEGAPPGEAPSAGSGPLRLVFVGSLIARKGLDVLIRGVASARSRGAEVTVDAFGAGDPSAYAFEDRSVRYRGRIPFGQAQGTMAGYDALVLPSRYDGWGVVVNEALCVGVPVLCSDRVGARVLVEKFGAGAVFALDEEGSLRDLLVALWRDGSRLAGMRAAARAAGDAIQPEVAAEYLLAVIAAPEHEKASIPSPWY